jgi:F-type H+-transporting ATPase subunit gamma
MKMVSAAKLRRAQDSALSVRPYAKNMLRVIKKIASVSTVSHPLLIEKSASTRMLLVVTTSDRGLCGAFNNSIIREVKSFYAQQKPNFETIDFLFVGRRGAEAFKNMKINVVDKILNLAHDISYPLAANLSERLWHAFLDGQYGEIRLFYNEFKSVISQKVVSEKLLPIPSESFDSEKEVVADFLFEPKAEEILDQLLRKHFAVQVYHGLLESIAAEHAARMNAMANATRNAEELISNLTLTYNKLRQANITNELIEITSGAEALKG